MQDATVLMMNANTLMLIHVLRNLPTAKRQAWVCSAGLKGYCALKEMLQSGKRGYNLLIDRSSARSAGKS